MRRGSVIAVVIVVLFGGARCESGGRFPPSDLSFEMFCPRWHAQLVALYGRCQDVPPEALSGEPCAAQAARIAAGRIGFDRSVATSCLRAWENATCAQFDNFSFPACEGLEPGLVDPGGACDAEDECAAGAFCDRAGACAGTCRAVVLLDGDCTASAAACTPRTTCVDTDEGRRCRSRIDVGGACGPGLGDCYTDLTCAAAAPGGAPTCHRSLFPGQVCDAAAQVCVSYATCGADGTCARDPVLNEPCGQLGERYLGCINAWCDGLPGGPPGLCHALLKVGASCALDAQCEGPALCVGNLCAAPSCPKG